MPDENTDQQPSLAQQSNNVKHVVGVMSGKGGVGKSLVTGLLASAFHSEGRRVGILDADITGPSIPKMFGVTDRPNASEVGMFPSETAGGIKVMSINLILSQPGDAVIWRGPLLSKAVQQFWTEVFWGELDYLFVDLPPGTSDVPLTVMQSLPLDCVVIVTSPQDLAAMIVSKAVKMCQMLETPVLGLVENMSHITCPDCGAVIYPFGRSGGEALARSMNIPHLCDLPLDPKISECSDAGKIEEYAPNPFGEIFPAVANGIEALAQGRKFREVEAPEPA